MPLTIQEFNRGLQFWSTTTWPRDFHQQFYQQIQNLNLNGDARFTPDWWNQIIPHLSRWRALRPCGQQWIANRANERTQLLRTLWNENIYPHLQLDIEGIQWTQVNDLCTTISKIKNVRSPVFVSKLSHFSAPKIFPVIDRKAMGLPFASYREYFEESQSEWVQTEANTRQELIACMQNSLQPGNFVDYPLKTKIIEICFIGRNYP